MNRKTYNFIIGSLLASFIMCDQIFIELVINHFNVKYLLKFDSKFNFLTNILKTLIASATFFSGFYFKFSIFSDLKNVIKPIYVILMGFIFILIVFIPSTFSFFMIKSISKNSHKLFDEINIKCKDIAITSECESKNNFLIARFYFEKNGEKINYRQKNGSVVQFKPTQQDIKKRKTYIEREYYLKRTIEITNRIFFFKVFSFIFCGMVWLVLLMWYPPRKILINS
jgi:hypothetical protein